MANNYRVLESQGRFWVQVENEITETSGMLWWKKTNTYKRWVNATSNGRAPVSYFRIGYFEDPMCHFKTLKEALKKIELFLTPVKIHYVNKPEMNYSFEQMANGIPEKIANITIKH